MNFRVQWSEMVPCGMMDSSECWVREKLCGIEQCGMKVMDVKWNEPSCSEVK